MAVTETIGLDIEKTRKIVSSVMGRLAGPLDAKALL